MTHIKSTIDPQEVHKFAQQSKHWWELDGPFKTLHDINPIRLEFISTHTPLEGLRVLDVGCGGGLLSEALAKAGALVSGLDAECAAIEAAKTHAQESGLIIDYVCSPIEEYESASFDIVTCMEMLEHVQKPELVLEQCIRLLKPGGLLFLSTINRTAKAYATAILAAEYILRLLPKQTHDYDKFIKPSELTSIARRLNLSLLDMQGMDYNPLSRQATLGGDVSVNYLMAFQL